MTTSANKPTKAYYNARRWAVSQRQQVLARATENSSDRLREQEAKRLAELKALASSLKAFPHMASQLAAVRAEISRLEATKGIFQ